MRNKLLPDEFLIFTKKKIGELWIRTRDLWFALSNGGICLGINYLVLNEMKRYE
jgi:hypothetical protein